ncbi:MAG: type III-B CRISPR module RAMP protein Cmr6 [Candidatus Thorarchaeota archaeon]|nr:type III-B CRISPR module RAMP protein Cmr6 [Candidatus Thorarchaeota archaeon]
MTYKNKPPPKKDTPKPQSQPKKDTSGTTIPFYQSDVGSMLGKDSNPSLVFDRFPDFWTRGDYQSTPTLEFLKRIVRLVSENREIDSMLQHTNERRRRLVSAMGGRSFCLKTQWRFVTGLGLPHPSEIGFRWNPHLSVPVIPGSSIKGALRSWMRDFENRPEAADTLLGKDGVGQVTILDALPSRKPKMEVDIINPHYAEYYSDPEKAIPGDYYSPIPVFFLATAPETEFLFHIMPVTGYAPSLDDVEREMRDAFRSIGLGAKGNSGYGRFI